MTFQTQGDLCLGFFRDMHAAGYVTFPPHARVLELGCAEVDWSHPMKALRPDLHITGLDWRGGLKRPQTDVLITANALEHEFAPSSFDAIVAISMVEWCGIGHYGDPVDEDGDSKLLQRCHRWLKPGGWLYFDTPYSDGAYERRAGNLRAYNDAELERRLYQGLWRVRTRQRFTGELKAGRLHPDAPYLAVVLDKA